MHRLLVVLSQRAGRVQARAVWQHAVVLVVAHEAVQLKLPVLTDEGEAGTPTPPPSSSRKKFKAPRSSIKNYETPNTKGDHWNVSDISIRIEEMGVDDADQEDIDKPDYSEPEYMPPKLSGED